MLCENPYQKGRHLYGCGQCLPCRFNRRRTWSHRIMLEAAQHPQNCFLTLTYEDDFLIFDIKSRMATLWPDHVTLFLKRLRKAYEPSRIRFYLVGEYGDQSERPHYHLAVFNFPTCRFGETRYKVREKVLTCCSMCATVQNLWPYGAVQLAGLTMHSAQYVAGYVTKKMTSRSDPRLKGRYPEYCRMSLRPGIGASAMWDVASVLMTFNLEDRQADVPVSLRHGNRLLPLGRYLRRKLRTMVGKDEKAPELPMDPKLQALFDHAWNVSTAPGTRAENRKNYRQLVVEDGEQRRRNQRTRQSIFKGKRTI